MFKYGGDVKRQGIMHGMNGLRDGGVATTMADATGYANGGMTEPQAINTVGSPLAPRDNSGRQGYALPLLAVPAAYTAGRMALMRAAPRIGGFIKNMYQGMRTPGAASQGTGIMSKIMNRLPTGRFRQGQVPGQGNVLTPAQIKAGMQPTMGQRGLLESLKDPRSLGAAIRENPFTAASALTLPNLAIKAAPGVFGVAKGAGKMFIDAVLPGEQFKEKPPVLKKTATGDRGSLLKTEGTTRELTTVEKEDKDKERLAKIYKLLGVDRSQRNAASKALVDVSRYIDEGGKDTVSKKNIGSTISKAISSFDKRLDKSDQLKEAAGVMMAKSYLEGGDKAQDREYKQVMIDAKKKEMNPDLSDLKAMYTKSGVTDAAGAAASKKFGSAYGGALMSTKDFNKQLKAFEGEQLEEKTILDIATNAVNNLELAGEGGKVKDGYYKVGTNVVLITDGKAIELVG